MSKPTGKRPFARQAAMFSAQTPAINILLGLVASIPALKDGWFAYFLGIVQLLLIVAGLGLGIAALFGIRKHGKKGILVPAIIGTTLNLLLLVLIITAMIMIPNMMDREVDKFLQQLEQNQEGSSNTLPPPDHR